MEAARRLNLTWRGVLGVKLVLGGVADVNLGGLGIHGCERVLDLLRLGADVRVELVDLLGTWSILVQGKTKIFLTV